MLSEHHELALNFEPKLEYDPNNKKAEILGRKRPDIYWRQGVPGQILDAAADALLVRESDGVTRLKTYHEFALAFDEESTENETGGPIFGAVYYAFWDFHPRRRPALWRILVTQAHLCELFVKSRAGSPWHPWADIGDFELSNSDVRGRFDWRKPGEGGTDLEVLEIPFAVARAYLQSRVPFACEEQT